ncbi:MAG TPA: DJ-1 family glyoxalase III [Candidatus Methylacidiphilales bacterium]|nr:DJ-1 family glyoxalase III [Candidatus Methylacidiphilales bacterium]
MKKTALVLLATGFEEIEAITTIDVLRRADMDVTVAGLTYGPIIAARKTAHMPDVLLQDVIHQNFDVVVLPGGNEGTANLKDDARVKDLLFRQKAEHRWVAAICAAPTILVAHEWLDLGQKLIGHPSTHKLLPSGSLLSSARVVVDGRLITSLAAGSAMEFAYTIVANLLGPDAVRAVDAGVCAPYALDAALVVEV